MKGIPQQPRHRGDQHSEIFRPYLLAAFRKQHAVIAVNLNVTNREAILRQLTDNIPDMAIMDSPPKGMPLAADSFMSNPLVIIVPLTIPWSVADEFHCTDFWKRASSCE